MVRELPPSVTRMTYARKDDVLAAGVFLLYCVSHAALRMSVSPTMILDEAEQFLTGAAFALGDAEQPPLYSWIVFAVSRVWGLSLHTLIVVKYCLFFIFLFCFYLTARTFQGARESLLITGSLLAFPTYSYTFNVDTTHSLLVTAMASMTCYVYVLLFLKRSTALFILAGAAAGLGILSKYNYVFFIVALLLASLSNRKGRRILFDWRMVYAAGVCLAIISPHLYWLADNNLVSLRHALARSEAGELHLHFMQETGRLIFSSFSGVLLFLLIFRVFFGRSEPPPAYPPTSPVFRLMAVYALVIPLFTILLLHTGHFRDRWLAPMLFILPLAAFSRIRMEWNDRKSRIFGYACIGVVAALFLVRVIAGFFPDLAGRAERANTPFAALSAHLQQRMGDMDTGNGKEVAIITDSGYLTANLMQFMPGAKFAQAGSAIESLSVRNIAGARVKLVLWDASRDGSDIPLKLRKAFPSAVRVAPVTAPYLHSTRLSPFVLGIAVDREER